MYEKYFREFVAFLFPNDLLDVSILDFIEGEQGNEEIEEYGKMHGMNLFNDFNVESVILNLNYALNEMRYDNPKIDLIDYYLDKAMFVLRNFNPLNLGKAQSFRAFLSSAK